MSRRRNRPVDIQVRPSGSEVLSVRLPSKVMDRIEEAADRAGVTISDYARQRLAGAQTPPRVSLSPPTANPAPQTWMLTL